MSLLDTPVRGDPAPPAGRPRSRRRAASAPVAGRLGPLLARRSALAAILLLVAVTMSTNLGGWPVYADDEGTYFSQAWSTLTSGELVPYTYWYDHPPAGWMQLAGLMAPLGLLFGSEPSVFTGRVVMVGYAVVTAALLYLLARNLRLRVPFALAVPALWGLSPLVVYESRQVLLDNMLLPWLVGAFVLATHRGRHLWHAVAAGLCFGIALLTKETALLLAPALLWAVWQNAYRPTRAFGITGVVLSAGATGAVYPLYALLKHELLPGDEHVSLWDAVLWQLNSRAGSGFVLERGTVANGILGQWVGMDGLLVVGGVVAAIAALAVRRLRPVALVVLVHVLLAMRASGYLPLMFVIVPLPFAAVLIMGLVDRAWALPLGARRPVLFAVRLPLVAGVAAAGVLAAPNFAAGHRVAATADHNAGLVEALPYVEAELPRDSVVMTDNVAWNDLVRAGWPGDGFTGALWYYKLDQDPEAQEYLPRGWRDVDYVLLGQPMAKTIASRAIDRTNPLVIEAYRNSTPIRSWGTGESRVELRRVSTGAPAGARS